MAYAKGPVRQPVPKVLLPTEPPFTPSSQPKPARLRKTTATKGAAMSAKGKDAKSSRPAKAARAPVAKAPRVPKTVAAPAPAKTRQVRKPRYVYRWGGGKADGDGSMKALLGGKGANLAEMTRIGLPVPPGFTITTEVCTWYTEHGETYPAGLQPEVEAGIRAMEREMGAHFGDTTHMPLLVAVRSGARDSMPGMMDTILNLGLNPESVEALTRATENERFAWDCYRRFIQMYGDVVMGVQKREGEDHEPFETVITALKHERYGDAEVPDSELTADDSRALVERFRQLVRERTGEEFPDDPWVQLRGAIGAVFGSWMNDRAVVYRRKYHIPSSWGTAVNVQAMVFGNTGEHSGSGVAFTRDPATGENVFYGEFLLNAQGEDVVAGVRTPEPVAKLRSQMPRAHAELERIRHILEHHFKDVQDFEFTIQDGTVFMLQTRNGKRTGVAAVRFAVEMVDERLFDWKTALRRVPAEQLEQVLAPVFDPDALKKAREIARGLPAGPGAATGCVYVNAERAAAAAERGEQVLLVRTETSPEDLRGMIAAEGILTSRGGVSSHAALVARQMGKVCVCGAGALEVDYAAREVRVNGGTYREGVDSLSIDGTSGAIYAGELPTAPSEITRGLLAPGAAGRKARKGRNYLDFIRLMEWCGKVARLKVRTNADTPEQVAAAIAFGADGIGLARTEHMFFNEQRIDTVREMILAATPEERQNAINHLLPFQKADFVAIFQELEGRPATVRLLDPPLHEFLPKDDATQQKLANSLGMTRQEIARRVAQLHEENPMLGHRGCRLGISFPELTAMQARAIFEAAAEVQQRGQIVQPEVMVPLTGTRREFDLQAEIIHRVAAEVQAEQGVKLKYLVGTMIEVPRGALVAGEIAESAEFFSFGTNDLTQMTLGISRDDAGSFLPRYLEREIYRKNPFASIDESGVGLLMEMAVQSGRNTRPRLKLGICGEHGGDPASVKFCHRLGLDYVSCSPFRVPVARLAAAQAVLEAAEEEKPGKKRAASAKSARSL